MTARDLGDGARRVALVAWAAIGVLVLGGMLAWLGIRMQVLVIPVVFAMVIVYLANPTVRWLAERGIPRTLGTTITYLLGTLTLIAVFVWTAPAIRDQAVQLVERLPVIYDDVVALIERTLALVGVDVAILTFQELVDRIGDFGMADLDVDLQATLQDLVGRVFSAALSVFEAFALFLVAPVVAFYILIDLPRLGQTAVDLLPERTRGETLHVAQRLSRALGGFVRGQLLAASFVAVLSAIGYRIIGLDLWLIVAIIAGLFNMIPFVGPWIAGTLAVGVALVSGSLGTVIAAAVVALVVQQLDNNFVSPLVLRATVKLHPALIILALLVGGSVGGLLGLILAVPVVAVAKVLIGHLWRTRVLGEPWEQAVEAIVHEPDPSATAEMLAVRIRSRRTKDSGSGPAPPEPGTPTPVD
ncbi:MAG: AI-2E family transporter [Acidimicrobiia bacterium]